MKKIRKIILAILLVSFIASAFGCSNVDKVENTSKNNNINMQNNEENQKIEQKEENEQKETAKENHKKNSDEIQIEGIPSPLSGIYGPEEKINRRPVAIMLDNHPKARWQAGISQAEIVYEFLVEYPYTRYMAIFLVNDPKHIGPIRSARPYFITALLQYDPIYVRVGGSEEAKADVKRLKLADIDGLASSSKVFWRYYKTGKKAPNNMYSSMEAIRKEQERRNYRKNGKYEGYKFNSEDKDIVGTKAYEVTIRYNRENVTKYIYDEEKKVYKRYKDDKLHIDELDNTPVTAKNIIIQQAKTKVIDSVGRLSIELVGEGKGIYITNGKAMDIIWKKKSKNSRTIYYDNLNNEINLNPGVTWIQVTRINPNVNIE